MNTRKKDYWEGEDDNSKEEIPLTAMELSEMIEQKIENGKKDNIKGWKKAVNSMIDEYNDRFGHTYPKQ